MSGSEIKQLEQQIDKNKNQILEEKEILDFIKDEKNLKSLGNFLKKLPMQSPYLSQKILNWIQASTLFNTQFQNWIKRKLQSNQSLTDKELQLLYIQAQIDPKCILKPQLSITSTSSPAFHISKTSLDRYWGKFLSQYLQAKYGKNSYSTAEERSDARFKNRNTSQEKQKEKEVRLPNINFKEGFSNVAIDRLQQRAKDNFYSELSKEKQWAQLRNSRKWEFKEAFVNYDLLLFAFNKYTELVNKKQEEAIKASGYKNAEDFFKQLKLIQDFNKFLEKKTKEKFPNLDQILASFSQFQKEQESLEKKYFKSNTEKQKIEQAFKNALKYQENLSKKYDLENIKKRFGSEPQKPEEAQKFFEDLNSLQAYQNELEAFQKRTQNVQNKYNSYLKDQQQLIQKYGKDNLKKSSEALHLYRIMLAWYKKAYSDINFDAYEKYGKIASKNRITEEIASIQSLKEILLNPLHKDFPLHLSGVKNAELEKQAKQAAIDKTWTMIKKNSPIIYSYLNAGASLWNWLVDSTIGVWSSLGLMLKKLWESDDEWKSSAEFKEKFDNFFKISLSTSQKNSIYDSETGEFNMNWDNGVSQVASSISQMITLIYGGGAIAKGMGMGAAKTGLKVWSNIASKAGLFSMAFTQQVGQSFQEGMQAGMNGKEALAYSFLSSGLQGSLELISPNEILLGKGSSLAKGFIKELCKKGSKQSLKEVWKLFTTTIGKEIFEENIQEAVQLAAWNLMNQWANKTWGTELPSDWNLKNFAATAIITTLTTWVTTGASSLTNMPGILENQDKAKLKAHILSNTELHADVMQVLEQAIEGKVNLSISKEDLITLKEELNASQTNIKKIEVIQKNQEAQSTDKPKYFEGIEVIQKNQETQSTDKPKYFEGKESKFWLSEVQTRKNSQFIDQISSTINQTNQTEQLQNLNTEISKQYQEATGKELHLSDDQLLSILDAHKQDGKLSKLTLWELKTKANILDKTIPDPEVRSFLLEAGFINEEANIFPNQVVKKIKDGIQMISKKYKFLRWEELILTDQEVDNLLKIITQLWINVSEFNIKQLSEISPEQIEKIMQIKEGLQQLGIKVDEYNIEELREISPSWLKELIKHDIRISSEGELILASQLIWDYNIATIKGLLERKTKYLEKYQTLSDKKFDELFKWVDLTLRWKKTIYEQFIEMINNLLIKLNLKQTQDLVSLQYGKNGIAEIKQTTLGYCYAYTGFNLLKRSNFFEVMIKTSIRETSEWWEVTVPFWSRNGKIIKVWKQEIHDSYRVLNEKTWTYKSKESKTTSKTSTWMKVLEIAFIKEYILEHNYLGDQKAKSEETRTTYKQAIEWARESFKKTGDFKLNGELLWAVEWGRTGDFLNRMIWENVVKKTFLKQESDLSKKDALFNFINNGTLKIEVGSNNFNPHLKVDWNFTIKDIWGKKLTLITDHAYSLERVYTTKSWEKVAVISNPRNTHEKIHVSRNDAMTKFHLRDVSYISPQKLFTE